MKLQDFKLQPFKIKKLFLITDFQSGDSHEVNQITDADGNVSYEHTVILRDGDVMGGKPYQALSGAMRALVEQFQVDNEGILEG